MQTENRLLDDIARVLNGVAGTVAGAGREAEAQMRERARGFIGGMDFVSREEFEAVKQLAATARAEVEALTKRLDALEGRAPTASAPKKSASNPVPTLPVADPHPSAPVKGPVEASDAVPHPSAPMKGAVLDPDAD